MTPLLKNLLLALGLAVIVWLGYTVFLQDSDELVTADALANDAAQKGQELLVLLQQVESIELQGQILEDPRFESLVDVRQDILDEPVGRQNPFAPIP